MTLNINSTPPSKSSQRFCREDFHAGWYNFSWDTLIIGMKILLVLMIIQLSCHDTQWGESSQLHGKSW